MKKITLTIISLLILGACNKTSTAHLNPVHGIGPAITRYDNVAHTVSLGDTKQDFLARVYPAQNDLDARYRKQPEAYAKNGVNVEIFYMRSGWQSDGLTTDDEFTPYLFNDEVLVGIGWTAISGTKTQGQSRNIIVVY
jgi:hypothetical protein